MGAYDFGNQIPGNFSPHTTATGPTNRQRWLSVKNMEAETIPGFSLVMLKHDDRKGFFCQDVVDGQVVWRVWKPDATAESAQDASMLMVTSGTPIPPGGYGEATQDWPAQVLHDGALDRLPNALPCGPRKNSFCVWSHRHAFTCMGHDDSRAQSSDKNGIHTVWISPNSRGWTQYGAIRTYDTGAAIPKDERVTWTMYGNADADVTDEAIVLSDDGDKFSARKTGVYILTCNAVLKSTTHSHGSNLQLTLWKEKLGDEEGSEQATVLGASRQQAKIETATQTFTWGENVAFAGPLRIEDVDQSFSLRNNSSDRVFVTAGILTITRIAPHLDQQDQAELVYITLPQ